MAVFSNILTLIIETALASYVATVAWNYRPGRLFLLVIAACAALSAGAIARQLGGPAELYGGKAARVLGLAGLSGALLLLLSALFMPSWWSGRRPIRWIALPYGLALLALALDLAAGSGLLVRIGAEADALPAGGTALAVAFILGWTVHFGLLIAAYASAPHQRPLISLLFGSLLLAMLVGFVNLRVAWLRDLAGLLETALLLSILAYIVLNRRLFEPTRVALELALRAMSEIVAVLDPEGKILFANPRARELGLRVDQLLAASQLAAGTPDHPLGGSDELARVIASGGVVSEPTVLDAVPIGDPPRLLELKLAPVRDRDGQLGGILLLGHDITEIERRNVLLAEEQRRLADAVRRLGYLATHDPMTDLPNRRSLELELAQALERAGGQAVLLFIDLDDFKLVNDSLGHAAGDEVLVAVTKRLAAQLRAGDLLARLGGDEFAVLLREGGPEAALAVARRMLEAVRGQDFALHGHRFRLGLSVGLAAVDPQFSAEELVEQADLAMYMAKERGGNQLMTYRPSMAAAPAAPALAGGRRLAERLQQAVGTNRLQLHYQPVVRLADRAVMGYEGLVRLHDEHGALLMPHQFLAAADRFGMMPALDRWIARCAIAALAGRPGAAISINLSSRSLFDPELPQFIAEQLAAAGVAAERLSVELAEPVVWQQFERAQSCFELLSGLGCGCVIDRVGSSFASFRTLAELPVSQIKLDGQLCARLASNPQQQAMLRSMAAFAGAVGKSAVATNVEDEATARLLGDLGLELAQGYCFGGPSAGLDSPPPA